MGDFTLSFFRKKWETFQKHLAHEFGFSYRFRCMVTRNGPISVRHVSHQANTNYMHMLLLQVKFQNLMYVEIEDLDFLTNMINAQRLVTQESPFMPWACLSLVTEFKEVGIMYF